MMKVSFAEIDEAYLRNKVETGYYSSLSEAVRDAVRKQRENDGNRLLSALEEGEKAIQESRTEPLTRQLFDEIIKEADHETENGTLTVNLDVIPQ